MLLHHLAFARALVVDATKVQNTMNNDAMQLTFEWLFELLGIASHRVEANNDVATDAVACGIIEGDDVGIVIVLKELTIAFEYGFIVDKLIIHFAQTFAMKLCNLTDPGTYGRALDIGHLYPFVEIRNCHIYNNKVYAGDYHKNVDRKYSHCKVTYYFDKTLKIEPKIP